MPPREHIPALTTASGTSTAPVSPAAPAGLAPAAAPTLDGLLRHLLRDVVREVVREELPRALAALTTPMTPEPEPELGPQYLTPQEAAEFCDVSEKTIRAWVHEGKLRCRRAGRLLRIDRRDLEAYLAQRDGIPPVNRLDVDALASNILARRTTK